MTTRIFFLISGLVLLIGGVLAILNPFAATLAAERLAGWVFLIGGILQLFPAFRGEKLTSRVWAALLAVVCILLGISLLFDPLGGILALTLVAAIMFLASGLAKVIVGMKFKGTPYFLPLVGAGALSVVLAILVFFNFAQAATVLLGIMLALELISSGTTLVIVAGFLKGTEGVLEGKKA